jgi:hypothetical protein
VNDPAERQKLLEMNNVNERLDYLVSHLSLLIAGGGE